MAGGFEYLIPNRAAAQRTRKLLVLGIMKGYTCQQCTPFLYVWYYNFIMKGIYPRLASPKLITSRKLTRKRNNSAEDRE